MFHGFSKVGLQTYLLEVAKKQGFAIDEGQLHESLHEGVYYSSQNIRNISVTGRAGRLMKIPAVYAYGSESPHQGWLIMEKLPEGSFLKSPLLKEERKSFLELFLEYKRNSEIQPFRPLTLIERQPAVKFHKARIYRWLELASQAEAERVFEEKEPIFDPYEFKDFFDLAMRIIENCFYNLSSMKWCPHSLVRPQKVFKTKDGKHYLVDFCRAGMRPVGYELAVIIWGDWLMGTDWKMDYDSFKEGIEEWIEEIFQIAQKLEIAGEKIFSLVMIGSLTERIIGAILADICANQDMPDEEKKSRIKFLLQYFRESIYTQWLQMH